MKRAFDGSKKEAVAWYQKHLNGIVSLKGAILSVTYPAVDLALKVLLGQEDYEVFFESESYTSDDFKSHSHGSTMKDVIQRRPGGGELFDDLNFIKKNPIRIDGLVLDSLYWGDVGFSKEDVANVLGLEILLNEPCRELYLGAMNEPLDPYLVLYPSGSGHIESPEKSLDLGQAKREEASIRLLRRSLEKYQRVFGFT